uniref:SFRICE_020228 n=1 Tax=Spodoptera frugiperda TaxID=7108 RepID=A0A2H1WQF9_SPOFR
MLEAHIHEQYTATHDAAMVALLALIEGALCIESWSGTILALDSEVVVLFLSEEKVNVLWSVNDKDDTFKITDNERAFDFFLRDALVTPLVFRVSVGGGDCLKSELLAKKAKYVSYHVHLQLNKKIHLSRKTKNEEGIKSYKKFFVSFTNCYFGSGCYVYVNFRIHYYQIFLIPSPYKKQPLVVSGHL